MVPTNNGQLSKQEETEEVEVRREDQDKINRFSTLHRKEATLEDELKAKQVCKHFSLPLCHSNKLFAERQGGCRGNLKRA